MQRDQLGVEASKRSAGHARDQIRPPWRPHDSPAREASLTTLQRDAGNRAVLRLLQNGAAGWSPGAAAPRELQTVLSRTGQSLPRQAHEVATSLQLDPKSVTLHTDEHAADAATMLDARAFTVGTNVVFARDEFRPDTTEGQALLRHELTHVAQARGAPVNAPPVMSESPAREHDVTGRERAAPNAVQRHPAEKALRWAAKWLTRRTAKLISKHIAKHTRAIVGKSVHSIFRNPREVKYLIGRAIDEATQAVGREGASAATHLVESGTIRVVRQTTRTPGKVRWVIEKTFVKAIGTEGQRVLRIVIDQTGRIVTAFPTDRLLALGVTAVGLELFSERTAAAAEQVNASVERQAALEAAAQEDHSSWWEWVPIIGDIWGGELNAGEDQMLAAGREREQRDRYVADVVAAVVHDIEEDRQASLGPQDKADVDELVRTILTSGSDLASDAVEGEPPGDATAQ